MNLELFINNPKNNMTISEKNIDVAYKDNEFYVCGLLSDYKELKKLYKKIKSTKEEKVYLCPCGDKLLIKNKLDKLFSNIPKEDLMYGLYSYSYYDEDEFVYYKYEDLIEVINLIKYYRSFLRKDLTPLEKVFYAYDLVKSIKSPNVNNEYVYKGDIKHYLDTGNIACMGYSTLLKNVLYNIDDNIKINTFITKSTTTKNLYHARNIIYVNDKLYKTHGIFLLDACWDSNRFTKTKNGKKIEGLDLYNCFLFNNEEFEDLSSIVEKPYLFSLFDEYKTIKNKYLKRQLRLESEYLFEERININKLNNLISGENSFEATLFLLINIRHLEGYTKKEIIKEINRYINHNVSNTEEVKGYVKDLVLTLKK